MRYDSGCDGSPPRKRRTRPTSSRRHLDRVLASALFFVAAAACGRGGSATPATAAKPAPALPAATSPVFVVLFTHIEDNTPTGTLGTAASRANYLTLRARVLDLAASLDPHSHESGGYNYSDVAHLLDLLGVGGSSVIGGHIWDPTLPQFSQWDRFRVPVFGSTYSAVAWRGSILMAAARPIM